MKAVKVIKTYTKSFLGDVSWKNMVSF